MEVILQTESPDTEALGSGGPEAGMARYLREVERCRLLSRSEEKILLDRVHRRDREALNVLVTHNLKWVVRVSREYRDRGLSMPDLIAEGNLALIRAALACASDQTCRFTDYAVWRIRRSLERALAAQTRFRSAAAPPAGGPAAAAPDSRAGPAPEFPLSPELRRALEDLREPARTVLRLCFGLGSPRAMSLEDISRLLGMDLVRVRRLKELALCRLQRGFPGARGMGFSGAPGKLSAGAGVR